MNTNVLLIIIIVLLALGLLVQLLQLIVIFSFPAQLLELFLDSIETLLDPNKVTGVEVIDVDISDQSQQTKPKGFGKSKKSKHSKRKWVARTNKTSTDASEAKSVQSHHLSSQKSVREDLSSQELTNTDNNINTDTNTIKQADSEELSQPVLTNTNIDNSTDNDIDTGINSRDPDEPDSLVDNSSSDLEAPQEVVKSERSGQVLEEEIPSAVVQLFERSKSGKVRQRELLEATGLSKQDLKNNPPPWWRKLNKRGIGWYELQT